MTRFTSCLIFWNSKRRAVQNVQKSTFLRNHDVPENAGRCESTRGYYEPFLYPCPTFFTPSPTLAPFPCNIRLLCPTKPPPPLHVCSWHRQVYQYFLFNPFHYRHRRCLLCHLFPRAQLKFQLLQLLVSQGPLHSPQRLQRLQFQLFRRLQRKHQLLQLRRNVNKTFTSLQHHTPQTWQSHAKD